MKQPSKTVLRPLHQTRSFRMQVTPTVVRLAHLHARLCTRSRVRNVFRGARHACATTCGRCYASARVLMSQVEGRGNGRRHFASSKAERSWISIQTISLRHSQAGGSWAQSRQTWKAQHRDRFRVGWCCTLTDIDTRIPTSTLLLINAPSNSANDIKRTRSGS